MKGKICCLHRLIIKIVRCNIKCWYIHMLNYLFGCNLSVFQLCVIFDMCYNSSSCSTINHSNSICLSVLPSINLPPTFRHWVWCQLSCGIRLRNIHHLVQLCLFYFLRWFMKVMDWCKVFGLCTHTPSCSIFFFSNSLILESRNNVSSISHTAERKKILSQSSDCSVWMLPPTEEWTHKQAGKIYSVYFLLAISCFMGFVPAAQSLFEGSCSESCSSSLINVRSKGFWRAVSQKGVS